LILWDGASIHRGEAVRKLLDTDHHQDIWLEAVLKRSNFVERG